MTEKFRPKTDKIPTGVHIVMG